jgi:flagellar protein FlaG
MASASVSSLILFIAAVTVAAGVAGTMVTSISEVSGTIEDRSVDVAKQIDTEIKVISDPGSDAVYNGTTVTVLVKNTGGRALAAVPDAFDVLVDGRYVVGATQDVEVVDEDRWTVGAVARLRFEADLDAGAHRVTIIVDGDEEVFSFTV